MLKRHADEVNNARRQFTQQNLAAAPSTDTQSVQQAQLKLITDRHANEMAQLSKSFQKDLNDLHARFRKENAAASMSASSVEYGGVGIGGSSMGAGSATNGAGVAVNGSLHASSSTTVGQVTSSTALTVGVGPNSAATLDESGAVSSSTSTAFLEKLSGTLNHFWTDQLHQMRDLGAATPQTEHDFKNHNDLPLARIKRIMKSDEDVRMISAEAPVLFAKACEMFILELTLRSWSYSENNKRRTLQKEDIREAIQRTDIFDFLVDVIH